jgi:hypothetical protein
MREPNAKPTLEDLARVISWGILPLAVWGFLSLGAAPASTCRIYRDGTDKVQSCDNGSYTVTDRHGRRRVYGAPGSSAIRGSASGRCTGGGMIEVGFQSIGAQFSSMGTSKEVIA